jgi:membrane protein involved in colicin uptake
LGGAKWECICITLEEYQEYMNGLRKSKDPNEKVLYRSILEDILPLIERQAEERAKKEARRLKEQENLMKLASAKRSSRISARVEKQKESEAAEEAERKRLAELAMAQAEEEKLRKMEEVSVVQLIVSCNANLCRTVILVG